MTTLPPHTELELEARLAELRALLANTAIIATQAERALCVALIRTIETLLHGEPTTPPAATHHQ